VASTNDVTDAEALPDLLQYAPGEIEQVSADGAYDQRKCYDTLKRTRREGRHPTSQRRKDLAARKHKGRTQVFRFKTIFGDRAQTRRIDNQFKELILKSAILNRMTHLGMPNSVKVTG